MFLCAVKFLRSLKLSTNCQPKTQLNNLSLKQLIEINLHAHILSGLIWVQTVCKGYWQTAPVGKELNPNARRLIDEDKVVLKNDL